jgi:hypothetical protein
MKPKRLALWASTCTLVVTVGCGGVAETNPSPVAGNGGTSGDAGLSDASTDGKDAAIDGAPPDVDPSACGCPEDRPVLEFGECVPPLRYGCEATVCTPGVTDCGQGYTCMDCAAAACCHCAACKPACVLTSAPPGPLPEYLKLKVSFGPANQPADITVEGAPFYVGALFYLGRVGNSGDLQQTGGGTCAFMTTAPGQPPGTVPVWVSQYGGGDPWVLSGFFTWSSGDIPTCTQPGFPCDPNVSCCETAEVPMACVSGRCRRK